MVRRAEGSTLVRGAGVPEGVPPSFPPSLLPSLPRRCPAQVTRLQAGGFQGVLPGTTGPPKALCPRVLAFLPACTARPRWHCGRPPCRCPGWKMQVQTQITSGGFATSQVLGRRSALGRGPVWPGTRAVRVGGANSPNLSVPGRSPNFGVVGCPQPGRTETFPPSQADGGRCAPNAGSLRLPSRQVARGVWTQGDTAAHPPSASSFDGSASKWIDQVDKDGSPTFQNGDSHRWVGWSV